MTRLPHHIGTAYLVMAGLALSTGCGGGSNFTTSSSAAKRSPVDADAGQSGLPTDQGKITAGGELEKKESFNAQKHSSYAPIDIILLVDTSGSMDAEKTLLEQNLEAFLKSLDRAGEHFDYQVFVISSNFKKMSNNPRLEVVPASVDSHNALNVIQYFMHAQGLTGGLKLGSRQSSSKAASNLAESFASYQPRLKLRPAAVKEFLVITDDNAADTFNILQAEAMATPLSNRNGSNRANSNDAAAVKAVKDFLLATKQLELTNIDAMIFKEDSEASATCTKAAIGSAYQALAADPDIGGKIFDLCSPSWSGLLEEFAEQIKLESLVHTYKLSQAAASIVHVLVNGKQLANDQYRFDAEANALVLGEKAIVSANDVVEVTYLPSASK